jgi:ABC-type branched-subunit amino acid transport system ATPase component/ABC-type branched-subunit amino acid transport system permease subunit
MDYVLHILVFLCIFAILAASYNLLIGFSGLFSMAHAAFYGIGAYTFALAAVGNNPLFGAPMPFPAALLLAVAVSAASGVLIAVPALRVNADYLVVLSFGFQTVAAGIFLNWIEVTGGEGGVAGVPRPSVLGVRLNDPPLFLLYALAITALAYYAVWRVTGTPFGRMLRAVRDDQVAAAAMGKNVVRVKITMFCFAGALAGLAGAVFAQYVRVVDPNSFRLNVSIEVLAMLILGGTANVFGSALGAAVLIVLPEALRFLDVGTSSAEQVRQIAFGVMLILILRFRPQGLLPEYWLPSFLRRRREREVREALAELERGAPAAPAAATGPRSDSGGAVDGGVLMQVCNVSKSFGGIQALKDFSTTLERGKITSLIGPNGAGKTTAFNVITGFLAPDGGSVHLRGRDITGVKPHQVSGLGIARSFQNLRLFYQMSTLDNVMVAVPGQRAERLWRTLLRVGDCTREERETRRRALSILDAVGLKDKALALAESLSYAEEKLLAVARLLAMDAELLLLDEPGSGLDPASLEALFTMIRGLARSGKTICIVEHNLDVIKELSDKVVFLDEGRALAEGPPQAILQNRELAERYFGT